MKISLLTPIALFATLAPCRWAAADCNPPTGPECCPGPYCPPIPDGIWRNAPDHGGEMDVDQLATQVTDHPPTGPTGVFSFIFADDVVIAGNEDFNPIYPHILYDAPPGCSYVLHDCKGVSWDETLCGYKWWHIDWVLDACGSWAPSLLTYRDPRTHIIPEPEYRYWYFTYAGELDWFRPSLCPR